jgi:hypothetical protein
VYVDDINIIGTSEELSKAINYLKKEFKMKDLEKTKLCLRLQIEHLNNDFFLCVSRSIFCKSVKTFLYGQISSIVYPNDCSITRSEERPFHTSRRG